MANETSSTTIELETRLTLVIKLILFSVPIGPSLLCSLYIMVCVVCIRSLRRRSNHIMISIVLIDFIELMCDLVLISLNYFATGHIFNISVCYYWAIGNYLLQGISSWLMAWASIDRYLIIFVTHRSNTFLRHDFPLFVICALVAIWYSVLASVFTCTKNLLDGTQFLCGGPCFNSHITVVTADWILIVLLPTLLIVAFSTLLLGRIIFKKFRRWSTFDSGSALWRRNRKLIIQLISIIVVYFITQLPLSIFSVVRLLGPADFLIHVSLVWLFYTPYLIYLAVPFAYVATTTECKKFIREAKRRAQPVVIPLQSR